MKPVIEKDHCQPRFWYASPPAIGPMNALKNKEMLRLYYFLEISIRVRVKKHNQPTVVEAFDKPTYFSVCFNRIREVV